MNITRRFSYSFSVFGLVLLVTGSCLKDNTEEYLAAHDAAFRSLKKHYNISESDHIGDNIYVHFKYVPAIIGDSVKPSTTDYIVLDYIGFDSGLKPFSYDITNKDSAKKYDMYRADMVYGPARLKVSSTFPGFYKAIQHMPEGSSSVILLPSNQAFGGYEPVVYEVTLYRVIEDLAVYDSLQLLAYMDSLHIEPERNSFLGLSNAFISIIDEGDSVPEMEIGDTAVISIYGYYVEADPAYVAGFPGRQFFPINESSDTVTFVLGEITFPVTSIVNHAVLNMRIGDHFEVLSSSEYTYGKEGFLHPYLGLYIVPPSIPLHYSIKLIDYKPYSSID